MLVSYSGVREGRSPVTLGVAMTIVMAPSGAGVEELQSVNEARPRIALHSVLGADNSVPRTCYPIPSHL
jgi:hypothetical protein